MRSPGSKNCQNWSKMAKNMPKINKIVIAYYYDYEIMNKNHVNKTVLFDTAIHEIITIIMVSLIQI